MDGGDHGGADRDFLQPKEHVELRVRGLGIPGADVREDSGLATCTHIHTHTYTYMYTLIHTYTHTLPYSLFTHIHTYTHIYIYT